MPCSEFYAYFRSGADEPSVSSPLTEAPSGGPRSRRRLAIARGLDAIYMFSMPTRASYFIHNAAETQILLFEPSRPRWPQRPTTDAFWQAIERVIDGDAASARRQRDIARKQRALRAAVTKRAWARYVDLEEAQTRRWLRWIEIVARWAHAEGKRQRRGAR